MSCKKLTSLFFLNLSCQPKLFGRTFSLTAKSFQNSTLCWKACLKKQIFFHWKLHCSVRNCEGKAWLLNGEVNTPLWFCYFQATDLDKCFILFQWMTFRNVINQNQLERPGYKTQSWAAVVISLEVWILHSGFRIFLGLWFTWKQAGKCYKVLLGCLWVWWAKLLMVN